MCHSGITEITQPVTIKLKLFSEAGWLPCVVGSPWPKEFTGDMDAPEDYDYFHELIAIDEGTCTCMYTA